MDAEDSPLWDAYRRTTFQVDTPAGVVTIRIDESSAEVDVLLRRNDAKEWAFITANNPASEVLLPEENQRRHTQLESDVRTRGLVCLQGKGIMADPGWLPETSQLILNLTRYAAVELGAKDGQNAIVHGKFRQAAELVDCR